MKMVRTLLLAAFAFALASGVQAQLRFKHFFVGASVGATNYKGDLDDNLTIKFTKPGVGLVAGYEFSNHFGAEFEFNQGWIGASDAKNTDEPRQRRNLSFRSQIQEVCLTLTYEFFDNNRKYQFRPKYSPYIFAGVGVYHFNPQGKLGDEWIDLQPLGTEGQYLSTRSGVDPYGNEISYPEPYATTQICIPFGIGVRYKLTKKIDLLAEFGLRKLFTDYLDDVSNLYPQMDQLLAENPTAYLMSDRGDRTQYPEGMAFWNGIRGDKSQMDWYTLTMVSAVYILDWEKCPKFR